MQQLSSMSSKYRFTLFINNQNLMKLLKDFAGESDCQVILRRYFDEDNQETPIWQILNQSENWVEVFNSETFSEILITLNLKPKHDRDVEFITKSMKETILFRGGGQSKNLLGAWTFLIRRSNGLAADMFKALKKRIKKLSYSGMTAGKHFYSNAFYPREGNWEFRASLKKTSTPYFPDKK